MRKRWIFAGLAALSLLLTSCFENEITVSVNKDGSGTIVRETVIHQQMLGMLSGLPNADSPLKELNDEEAAKKAASRFGPDVEFVEMKEIERNGNKGGRVTYKFADINKVKLSKDLGGPGNTENVEDNESIKLHYADGKLTMEIPAPVKDEEMPDEEEADGMMAMQMKEMLKGMKSRITVKFPGGIAETNATHREGKEVVLQEVVMDEILKDPEGLKKLMRLGKIDDREKLAEALKDFKGMKMETKEKVTVTLQ